ncbi:MAG: SOS response-associated peptidase [Betaproteobacteria bacterium]|nr:SOS response-associated peptidase [Betaproteobacteria bacterium]
MCGRYVVAYDPQTLVSGFSLTRVVPFPKRWNIAPQSAVPVVYETREGERVAELMRWGLVPHWAKDASIGHKLNNARAEGVFDKPSFRQAARRRRCLLPASGFYEWQAPAAGLPAKTPKQPWYFSAADGAPLAMAGLFEAWRPSDEAEWVLTCCIITTVANALMAPIHERMPVLLQPEHWSAWLSRGQQDAATLAPMLLSCPPELLRAWPVSRAVSRGTAEGEALIEPLADAPAAAG